MKENERECVRRKVAEEGAGRGKGKGGEKKWRQRKTDHTHTLAGIS